MDNKPKTGSSNALGIVSIILGILVLLFSFIPCIGTYGVFLSIIPIILGATGYYIAKKSEQPTGTPLGGLIISMIALCISGYQYYAISSMYDGATGSSTSTNVMIALGVIVVIVGLIIFYSNKNKNERFDTDTTTSTQTIIPDELIANFKSISLFKKEDDAVIKCPNCSNSLAKTDVFCRSCGNNVRTHIQMALLANCPDCQAAISPTDAFCASCGFNITVYKQHPSPIQARENKVETPDQRYTCTSCNSEYMPGDLFCENCGSKLQ